jgi:hypothetical protein
LSDSGDHGSAFINHVFVSFCNHDSAYFMDSSGYLFFMVYKMVSSESG